MSHDHGDRAGAKQPHRFDPARAHKLDDAERETWLPRATVFALLDAPPNANVLDFGAGTGTLAIPLARERTDLHVFAFDEQEAMLALLRERIADAGLTNCRAVGPTFPTESARAFARVLAVNVLHELGDDALRAVREHAAPNGAILFVDWNADVERPVGPRADHVFSPSDALARLATLGMAGELVGSLPYHYAILVAR